MSLKKISIFLTLCCLTGCMSSEVQFQQGKQAFQEKRYASAFHDLLPLARQGNAEAQYAVGYSYYYGKGVNEDQLKGRNWIHKAAQQGYPPAIRALEIEKVSAKTKRH